LQKLHGLRMVAEFMSNFGQLRERLRVVWVQNTTRLHGALLCLTKVFESVRISSAAVEHLAVVKQRMNVFALQRQRLAYGRAVCNVRNVEWRGTTAAEIKITGKKLESNLNKSNKETSHYVNRHKHTP
jgi:hypothetical protein